MFANHFFVFFVKAHAIMNFVVKYHLTGQTKLRPHHDSSTFTVNMALSMPGVDHTVSVSTIATASSELLCNCISILFYGYIWYHITPLIIFL